MLSVPSALAATRTVDITQAGFTPGPITIAYGDTVTWTNKDNGQPSGARRPGGVPDLTGARGEPDVLAHVHQVGQLRLSRRSTRRRGTVIVRPGVSMKASAAQVGYGGTLTLSGTVSSGAAGET